MILLSAAAAGRGLAAPVLLDDVRLEGGQVLGRDRVMALLGVSRGALCDTLALPDGLGRLLGALADEGFLLARAEMKLDAVAQDSSAAPPPFAAGVRHARYRLDVHVFEGRVWHLGRWLSDGIPAALLPAVERATRIREGAAYRTRNLAEQVDEWLKVYDEAGYPFARIRLAAVTPVGDRIDVHFTHDPGPLVTVEGLELAGATVTRPRTAERAMGFHAGAVYRQSALEQGMERLKLSGLFAEVSDGELLPGTDPAKSRIRVKVREARSGALSGVVGYSGADRRLAGDLDFRLRNIAGTGRQLRLRWSALQRGTTVYAFGYREPYLLGAPLDLSLDLEHVLFDTLYTRTRLDVAGHARLSARVQLTAGVGSDRAVITTSVRRTRSSLRVTGGGIVDGRDSPLAPTRGACLEVTAERGKTLAGTYGDFGAGDLMPLTRLTSRIELYQPLGHSGVIALITHLRSLSTPALPVPQYELYPLGGATSLRGYREEQFFTPGYLLGQLEYRLRPGRGGSGVYLFVDAAEFARADQVARLWPSGDLFRLGYGAGLRLASGLGRVGIDYGLARGDGPLDGRIHLRIESEF